jgi:hypothetical protein
MMGISANGMIHIADQYIRITLKTKQQRHPSGAFTYTFGIILSCRAISVVRKHIKQPRGLYAGL